MSYHSTGWDVDAFQFPTTGKCASADILYSIWQGDGGKIHTASESGRTDTCGTFFYFNRHSVIGSFIQGGANVEFLVRKIVVPWCFKESEITDMGNGRWENDMSKRRAVAESRFAYSGYAFRNNNSGEVLTTKESAIIR